MNGLPVAVLHDYKGDQATMQVRVARLFDAVNLRGNHLARIETVTLLNDLCFWTPSAFVDPKLAPQFQWQAMDDSRAEVRFTQGAHTVQATLLFNSEGDLVVVKMIGSPEGDFRDWAAIKTWAKSLAPVFRPAA